MVHSKHSKQSFQLNRLKGKDDEESDHEEMKKQA